MKAFVSLIVLLSIFLSSAIPAFALQARDWNSLLSLSPGIKLVVQLKGGTQLKGKLRSADDDSISIENGGRPTKIPRDEVHRVYLGRSGSRMKGAFIGAAIGLGIGIGAGVLYERNSPDADGLAPAAGILYGAPAGAAIGALASGGTKKGTLIYEAP